MRRAKHWRWLQRLTGVHRIHDVRWSYGWKLPIVPWAYFRGVRSSGGEFIPYGWHLVTYYHDCTATGTY
jgi:hypothetical protein